MGLAASQARFLCITARKADCEYKSTELAQEKLEITNQLSDISATYANAMNSTKLVWSNEAVNNDYGLTYSLVMTPSDMNNYNPYMVTTASGAIILNSEYAAAAKAAGISKAGGVGSQDGRDKFISALVAGGIVTQESASAITQNDYTPETVDGKVQYDDNGAVKLVSATDNGESVSWNSGAGMGSTPLDKASMNGMDKAALILSESIGQKTLDWTQLVVAEKNKTLTPENQVVSETEYNNTIASYNEQIKKAKTEVSVADGDINDNGIAAGSAGATSTEYDIDGDGKASDKYKKNQALEALETEKAAYEAKYPTSKRVKFDSTNFQTEKNEVKDSGFTIVQNGIINKYEDELESMTIGDLLSSDIVLMTQNKSAKEMSEYATTMLEYIAGILGYGQTIGTGLNVDSSTNDAMEYAMTMTKNIFLKSNNAVTEGSRNNDSSMTENSAYLNATKYNRIANSSGYQAVSLSNMLSSFLTYFDNYMNGTNSSYVVGKTVDTTAFVTDDSSYTYIGQASDTALTQKEKLADFYDQLYNNLCEKGWREDDAIDDSEYLESMLKRGNYSMSSLNEDGYYYQTRYNETGYIVEETDSDAIARAEAEFTQKKAELTYKEDSIDLKTKKLDTEISSLTTEYETVKNLISKSIEKTFQMFQN